MITESDHRKTVEELEVKQASDLDLIEALTAQVNTLREENYAKDRQIKRLKKRLSKFVAEVTSIREAYSRLLNEGQTKH